MTSLPPIATVPSLDTFPRATILNTLFEPCTQLRTLSVSTLSDTLFPTYDALVAAVGSQLTDLFRSDLESDQKWLDAILSAHPRLGEKKVESELSRKEQAAMAAASGGGDSEEVKERLRALNEQYETMFPGLRYV
jgi:2-oxo-4-hydroxy-4-carboxy--5-ureidoimidazoline (OHCU) decarboxylase